MTTLIFKKEGKLKSEVWSDKHFDYIPVYLDEKLKHIKPNFEYLCYLVKKQNCFIATKAYPIRYEFYEEEDNLIIEFSDKTNRIYKPFTEMEHNSQSYIRQKLMERKVFNKNTLIKDFDILAEEMKAKAFLKRKK